MTHTLETTAIARGVARALQLNEDLTEAIGLGHDTGHPPFGHAGEEALDECLRERFGRGFRHNEQSLRIARAAEPDLGGARRHPQRTPAQTSPTRSRGGSSGSSTASRTSTTTSTTRSGSGSSRADELPAEELDVLGPTGSKRIDTLVHDSSRPPPGRRHRPERGDRRARCCRCAAFMFERVYLGPKTRGRARACAERRPDGSSSTSSQRGDEPDADRRLSLGHDRPLRARLRRARSDVARLKDESVEAVKAAANIVDLVEARTRLRKVGGRYTGLCPFHEERTPSFSVSPDRGTYHCFGCGVGGDAISFVRETEGLDFVGAIEWLADRFHVQIEYEESSPHADEQRRTARSAARAARAGGGVLRARRSGTRSTARSARAVPRVARARRGGVPRVPARALARRGDARPQGAREVLRRRARRGRARHSPRHRLLPAPADVPARRRARPRDRVPGAQAPRGRPAARQVRELARERALPQVERPLRVRPRPRRDREAGSRDRRRGEHRRDRAAAGEARAGRRVDGHRAHRAAAVGAVAADAPACSSASTPTRPARTRRCAAWSSRFARGSTFASSHCPRARTPPTSRRRSRSGSQTRSRTPSTACGWSWPGRATASMRTCACRTC